MANKTEIERLNEQRNRFMEILKDTFETTNPDRLQRLQKMYELYGDRLIDAPASSKIHFHSAYAGGYIDHILNVYDNAVNMAKILIKGGGTIDFGKEELVMAAFHHDLWKLGIPGGEPYYIPETSDWHKKNQNSVFKNNDKLPFMKVTDGAHLILQSQGIVLTTNEWIAIKLSDGLYEDSNKGYLMNYGKFPIHSNLPHLIHWADHMSTVCERDPLKQEFVESLTNNQP